MGYDAPRPFVPGFWVPACAGMTGECAGMTVGVGLPQMGYDGRAQLFRFGRDNVVLRDLSVNVLSVKRISRRPAPTPTS